MNFRSDALFEAAVNTLKVGECDGQTICNLLWAWAVTDQRHMSFLHKLHAAFLALVESDRVDRAGLSQAHQYQLWVEHELCEPSLLFEPPLRQRCREALEVTHLGINVSGLQSHVARVLRMRASRTTGGS